MRETHGYTQSDVANAIGVSLQQIYRWESGKNDPTGDMIIKLAKYLEVSSDYLLGITDDPLPHITENDLSLLERKLIGAVRSRQIIEAIETLTVLAKDVEKGSAASS